MSLTEISEKIFGTDIQFVANIISYLTLIVLSLSYVILQSLAQKRRKEINREANLVTNAIEIYKHAVLSNSQSISGEITHSSEMSGRDQINVDSNKSSTSINSKQQMLTEARIKEIVKGTISEVNLILPEARDAIGKLITAYHEQALSQARVQFWFSVIAATIGFVMILYGGFGVVTDSGATVARILAGLTLDAVAALFFKQASETRQRATELYDRLRRDKQLNESVALVASIEDIRVRSAVKAQIALQMSGMQPAAIDLTKFLSGEAGRNEGPRGENGTKE